jgi:Zn-dependent M32 family carboxypeptidase
VVGSLWGHRAPSLTNPAPSTPIFIHTYTHSALGFDYDKGRIDVSVHPFTGGSHPTDVRITTRYSENWSESVSGTVHEVGG